MNKNLNILIFAPLALENGRGGEISAMELASGLQKDYNITLIDTNIFIGKKLLNEESIKIKLKNVSKSDRIKFATFHLFNKTFTFPYPWEIIKLSKNIKKQDILYTSLHTIKLNLILILFSLFYRQLRFIIGYRKPIYSKKLFSLYNIKFRISILLFSIFKKRFYHHTISYHAKKYLENFYEPHKVVHVIHGIELDNFIKEQSFSEKNDNLLKFIYIGYLDDVHKGVGVLIKGIRKVLNEEKIRNIFFEFCGAGPLGIELKKLEREFPQFIKYHGYISNESIPEYYRKSDVLLFSSRREPFGRVIIEALASKLLILSTKTFGSMEILKNQPFSFFIDKLESKYIKKKIYEIYNIWTKERERFIELKELAQKYAIKRYDYSNEIQGFINLINKITSKNN
ncbi:MAG: glycosyltransferase family 4 protein, partial [Promethearchaeota archaeon]